MKELKFNITEGLNIDKCGVSTKSEEKVECSDLIESELEDNLQDKLSEHTINKSESNIKSSLGFNVDKSDWYLPNYKAIKDVGLYRGETLKDIEKNQVIVLTETAKELYELSIGGSFDLKHREMFSDANDFDIIQIKIKEDGLYVDEEMILNRNSVENCLINGDFLLQQIKQSLINNKIISDGDSIQEYKDFIDKLSYKEKCNLEVELDDSYYVRTSEISKYYPNQSECIIKPYPNLM